MNVVNYKERAEGKVVLCLGRYESLHLGHRAIIDRAVKLAEKLGAEVMLMTYDEGDDVRFRPLLLNFAERSALLRGLGVDRVMRVEFGESFMNTSAEDFLFSLKDCYELAAICTGFDFGFGRARGGSLQTLKDFCDRLNIPLCVTDKVESEGQKISSSTIKGLVKEGEVERANAMLGYKYFLSGKVEEGRREGRKLGFPTANIACPSERVIPRAGVYFTRVTVGDKQYKAITNVGSAPTFGVKSALIESHLIDFDGELYGKNTVVEFECFIREQVKFSSIGELILQLEADRQFAIGKYDKIRTERKFRVLCGGGLLQD